VVPVQIGCTDYCLFLYGMQRTQPETVPYLYRLSLQE
jgi:hypothetical protein